MINTRDFLHHKTLSAGSFKSVKCVKRDASFEKKPIGLGVFATRRVKKKIYFSGGEYICLTKLPLTSRRRDYAVCCDDRRHTI